MQARHPGFLEETHDENLRRQRITNQLIGSCIADLITASSRRIEEAGVSSAAEARAFGAMLIGHSPEMERKVAALHTFLWERVYRHPSLQEFSRYAREVLGTLDEAYLRRPEEMAPWYREWAEEVGLERAVCDYLAGMTDRFAEREFERLGGPS